MTTPGRAAMTDTDQIGRLRRALVQHQRRAKPRATGPRTVEGKARAAGNAVKQGLGAQVIRDPGERQRFEGRLAKLRADLEPMGEMEEALVERIAFALHGLERAEHCAGRRTGCGRYHHS